MQFKFRFNEALETLLFLIYSKYENEETFMLRDWLLKVRVLIYVFLG